MNDKYVFFFGGIYSQWYPCTFVISDVEYNCAEQFMMAEKARLFGDKETEEAIMMTDEPARQKMLGRTVVGFDKAKWEAVAKQIVTTGNYAKFKQNPDLRNQLMALANRYKIIVEASPYDKIWGIGLSEFDPDRFDESKWQGTNWLGECIMAARDQMWKEDLQLA